MNARCDEQFGEARASSVVQINKRAIFEASDRIRGGSNGKAITLVCEVHVTLSKHYLAQ